MRALRSSLLLWISAALALAPGLAHAHGSCGDVPISELRNEISVFEATHPDVAPVELPAPRSPEVTSAVSELRQGKSIASVKQALVAAGKSPAEASRATEDALLDYFVAVQDKHPEIAPLVDNLTLANRPLAEQLSTVRRLEDELDTLARMKAKGYVSKLASEAEAKFLGRVAATQKRVPSTTELEGDVASLQKLENDVEGTTSYMQAHDGRLPPRYKSDAELRALGWEPGKPVPDGVSRGGEPFANNPIESGPYAGEHVLPEAPGRTWTEADVGTALASGARGKGRLLYSNDGLIYFSPDHYKSPAILVGRWK